MRKHMTISEFLNREEKSFYKKAKYHIKKNKTFYITVGGMTLIFLFTGMDGSALAATGAEVKAKALYKQLALIGKWIIIAKGAVELIQSASQGDFDSVKSKFIKYVMVFLALLALPWAMDQIQDLFEDDPK